jgi:hypothetical protein
MGGVDQVEVELDDLLEAGSDRLEGSAEVVEHLPGLGADVVGADQRPRRVQGDLPGRCRPAAPAVTSTTWL